MAGSRLDVGTRGRQDVQHCHRDFTGGGDRGEVSQDVPVAAIRSRDDPQAISSCVFDIPDVGRFGLCICYDMWFPEVSRQLAWMGAEVILQPTLTPTSDRELELAMARANALFNQCYFFSVNGIGEWGGGRSTIIDPDGRVLQEASTNQTFITEMIDLDHTTRTREFGTLGLAQTLKQLRDSGHKFPYIRMALCKREALKNLDL